MWLKVVHLLIDSVKHRCRRVVKWITSRLCNLSVISPPEWDLSCFHSLQTNVRTSKSVLLHSRQIQIMRRIRMNGKYINPAVCEVLHCGSRTYIRITEAICFHRQLPLQEFDFRRETPCLSFPGLRASGQRRRGHQQDRRSSNRFCLAENPRPGKKFIFFPEIPQDSRKNLYLLDWMLCFHSP